jgi:FSR family fosmidomycin resistance protein-like MFS transporter
MLRFLNNKISIILFLGLGHGLNDLIAGYFLGSLVQTKGDILQISLGLFLYNLLAFGGQYPVALLLEKISSPKRFLLLAYTLNITAVVCFTFSPQLSIVAAGIASAIYHVAGGTVCAEKNKATNIGLFAAPGVAGLILGGYLAYEKIFINWWLLIAAIIVLIFIAFTSFAKNAITAVPKEGYETNKKFKLDKHDYIMILLLTIISLRSVIWDIFQLIHENNYRWLIAIAIAAFVGKLAGGWISDRIGWRSYTFISLSLATPLISFFKNELILFCIGIALLQSSIPATTSLLIQSLKGKTERAIGLSFGAAIMAGAFVLYTPVRNILLSDYFVWITTAFMLIFLFFVRKKSKTLFS